MLTNLGSKFFVFESTLFSGSSSEILRLRLFIILCVKCIFVHCSRSLRLSICNGKGRFVPEFRKKLRLTAKSSFLSVSFVPSVGLEKLILEILKIIVFRKFTGGILGLINLGLFKPRFSGLKTFTTRT